MELVLNRNEEQSVEECMRKAVEGMNEEGRLEAALQVINQGLESEERAQDVIAAVWNLVLREEWWKARYGRLDEFIEGCGIKESVSDTLNARAKTERTKRKFEQVAAGRWGKEDLEAALGAELMPTRASKHFLERMKAFSKSVTDPEDAKELLLAARDRRLLVRGASKDAKLRIQDIDQALKEAGTQPPKRVSQIAAEGFDEDDVEDPILQRRKPQRSLIRIVESEEEPESTDEPQSAEELETDAIASWEDEKRCGCARRGTKAAVEHAADLLKGKDLSKKLEILSTIADESWERMCYRHVQLLASKLELQSQGLRREDLMGRLRFIMANREQVAELVRSNGTYKWFRKHGRPEHPDDRLGPFKLGVLAVKEFAYDREVIWERYAAAGAMEIFIEDGNVVVPGVFDWIVNDPELMGMVDAEFEMYRHHLREQNGVPNYGWCRNMWHSLVQQVMRQDPVFYALNVAARPDGNWKLVSFPYYTKFAMEGDSTGFRHIDINVPELLKSGRGENLVQSAISMDDEMEDGCTILVPGFQRQIREWWAKVVSRGQEKNGGSHAVEDIYLKEDEEKYGEFVRVVCGRGDVRLTVGQVIHGSTGRCVRRRRVVYPWLVGVDEKGKLELSGSWEDVSGAHRKMEAVRVGPNGQSHRFGIGEERFAGSVELRGVSGLGDALLGQREWDSRAVLIERDLILGRDGRKAWEYVKRVRARIQEKWKECFKVMVAAEAEGYGEEAYFKGVDALWSMASEQQ